MGSVTRNATVFSVGDAGTIQGPLDPATKQPIMLPCVQLGAIIAAGTSGEQRVSFMLLETDYESLGSPAYNAPLTITVATA